MFLPKNELYNHLPMSKSKKAIITIIIFIVVFLFALCALAARFIVSPAGRAVVVQEAAKHLVAATPDENNLIQSALGFDSPKTYLFLLLNNTELRPGGGFIGAYMVVTVNQGVPDIVKVEGTEILDNFAPDAFLTPPKPLSDYLKISKWQFRDSNWSPDFPSSVSTTLALYKAEHGVDAATLDGVIGFTPTVMENILKLVGPVTVDGQTFTSDNFTEQLEYQVEYGYASQGVSTRDRKQTLGALAKTLLPRLIESAFAHWSQYAALFPQMVAQKQLIFYSTHPDVENVLQADKLNGSMQATRGDYLMWVDANLGALKTDASLTRSLSYEIAPMGDTYVATATMQFVHTGKFDWRTTRYRDYARVYVPLGSTFLSASGTMVYDKNPLPGPVDQGIENGRQWFGGFISIEPGQTRSLSFHYQLPSGIANHIASGPDYTLDVQKELGTLSPQLTVHLNFGTKRVATTTPEAVLSPDSAAATFTSDLSVDRNFEIKF